MQTKSRIAVTLLIAAGLISGLAEELPNNAGVLIKKLDEWEAAERSQLEREIATKRRQVIALLEHELENETQKKNLDGALLIRNKIAELTALVGEKPQLGFEDKPDGEFELNRESIAGTAWKSLDGRTEGGRIEFLEGGEIIVYHNENPEQPELFWRGWKYKFDDEGEFQVSTQVRGAFNSVRLTRKNRRMEIAEWGSFELFEKPKDEDPE